MIIAYRAEDRAFFLYGFAKNVLDNISNDELLTLRELAADMLARSEAILKQAKEAGELQEIDHGERTQ